MPITLGWAEFGAIFMDDSTILSATVNTLPETREQTDPFFDLPHEVLLQIWSKFPASNFASMIAISKQWQQTVEKFFKQKFLLEFDPFLASTYTNLPVS